MLCGFKIRADIYYNTPKMILVVDNDVEIWNVQIYLSVARPCYASGKAIWTFPPIYEIVT